MATGKREPKLRTISKTAAAIDNAITEQGRTKSEVAESAGVSAASLGRLLGGRSGLKRPESLVGVLGVLRLHSGDAPELWGYRELPPATRWLVNRLAASRMTRAELVSKANEVALEMGVDVKLSKSLLAKILVGKRFLRPKTNLMLVLMAVLGDEGLEGAFEDPDPVDLALAWHLVRGYAAYQFKRTVRGGILGELGALLSVHDWGGIEEEKLSRGGELSMQSALRYQARDRALKLVATGDIRSLEDFGLPRRDLPELALLLLGLTRPDSATRILGELADRLSAVAPAGASRGRIPWGRRKLVRFPSLRADR